ncbi:hypothetical protein D3C72_2210750 [compost metagenome]
MVDEGLGDHGAELVVVPGFGEELVDGALVDGVGDGFQVGVAGKHDADGIGVEVLDPAEELGAVHFRHALVGEDDLDVVLGQVGEGVLGAGGGEYLVAVAA